MLGGMERGEDDAARSVGLDDDHPRENAVEEEERVDCQEAPLARDCAADKAVRGPDRPAARRDDEQHADPDDCAPRRTDAHEDDRHEH